MSDENNTDTDTDTDTVATIPNWDHVEINNAMLLDELADGRQWIHGTSRSNISITIFIVTIGSAQLKYSLDAINALDTEHNVAVHVIMNVCPTNRAYNEMRVRCATPFFVQLDEDMELYPTALHTITSHIRTSRRPRDIFLHTYKLVDTCLGVGTPPLIDCLKIYNNAIMRMYPTYLNGSEPVSSVDSLWHAQLANTKFRHVDHKTHVGFHGKHRSSFDLMLRHCKILTSVADARIKTNSGHMCKLLRSLFAPTRSEEGVPEPNNQAHRRCARADIVAYFSIISNHLLKYFNVMVDPKLGNRYIALLNAHVPVASLQMYDIEGRADVPMITRETTAIAVDEAICAKLDCPDFAASVCRERFFCVLGILCVMTNNYAYSKDAYPYEIYRHFDKRLSRLDNKNDCV